MSLEAGHTLAHYEILEPVGQGGMGEVYRARDAKLGRDVAIKVLPREIANDAERSERFRREARTLAALNHPNIVTIHSIGDEGEMLYLTMELDPDLAEAHASRGLALSLRERDEEAEAAFEAEAATELAWSMVEHQLGLNPKHVRAMSVGAHCLVELGQVDKGLAWADRVVAKHSREPLIFYVACAYARGGRPERTIACLEATIEAGWSHGRWLDVDTDLDSLRGEPAFEALRERLR